MARSVPDGAENSSGEISACRVSATCSIGNPDFVAFAGNPMQITLINHACVKIALGDVVILCDPWLSGPAFNNGWDLLVSTATPLEAVMAGVTHIWVSHEHPDHFVPKFFIDIAVAYKSIPVLFQATRDQRVKSFIESRGFAVTELANRRTQAIGGVRITCGVSDFYDSWLHVSDGTHAVLNL